jgi:site-specific DNA-methyltransferase (adenine-specific)
MKRNVSKQTLSFSTSKSMKYLRTPVDIWKNLKQEFNFTLDACASHKNHLVDKYYTIDENCLIQDWTGEVVYCHPLFDMHIGKFVEKCAKSKCLSVLLLPASTHTRYFHQFIWDKQKHQPKSNVEVRFLEKPNKGFRFLNDDGSEDDISKIGYIKPLMVIIFRNAQSQNSASQVVNDGLNISLKTTPSAPSKSATPTSLNNNIKSNKK